MFNVLIRKLMGDRFNGLHKSQVFNDNDEMYKIMLWDLETDIGEFDEVDRKMIELWLRDET